MDPEEYRKKLELNILKIIEEKLIKGEMEPERAQAIARMVLNKLHPAMSLEQIYQIAPTLDDYFIELAKAVVPIIKDRREETEKAVAQHALKLIHANKFNEASTIMKQAIGAEKTKI